jgi:lipopolysaccharide heptosyltransferase I
MRILIVKPSSLGDIICSLPVAQSIRDQLPEAEISWVVKSRFADVVRRCPTVNGELIEFEHSAGWRGITAIGRVMRTLRQRHFDAVLDFQGLLRSGLMTFAANSPLKVGIAEAREGSRLFYSSIVPLPETGSNSHAIRKLLQFLPAIGLKPELRSPVVMHGDPLDQLDSRLNRSRLVVMIPNSRGAHKEWRGFRELTTALLKADSGCTVVWDSHLPWESPEVCDQDRFLNLTKRTSLLQLIELLRRADLVIANDSGPLHMAAALGRPTLALFGPTSPDRFGAFPPDVPRNRFLLAPEGDLGRLGMETVLDAALAMLPSAQLRNVA